MPVRTLRWLPSAWDSGRRHQRRSCRTAKLKAKKTLLARLLATRTESGPAPRLLPTRLVAVCRLRGMFRSWAKAQKGSYSGRS